MGDVAAGSNADTADAKPIAEPIDSSVPVDRQIRKELIRTERSELAERWAKIATKLPPHEAAAVRLHAIQLLGDDASRQSLRQEYSTDP